jgi:ribose transport system substrate-binding protein
VSLLTASPLRILTFVAGAIFTAQFVAGCSTHSASGVNTGLPTLNASPIGSNVAFVTNGASDYWVLAHAGVDAAQTKLGPNVNVQFVMPADGTAATQKQEVDDLLANGVKAIAISPIDPANQTSWLNSVASKAALITQDSDAPQSSRLCYLGTDNHAAGVEAGELIKQALGPQGGKVMLFVGNRSAQNAHDREQGIRDALAHSNVTVVDVRTDDGDHARAKSNAADALVANPDLAAEVGLWSYNGPAILSAVEDAHKVGKVKIICFDQEKPTLAGVQAGAIYATVVQQPFEFGYKSAMLLAQLAKGDKTGLPKGGIEYVPTEVVNDSNVAAYIVQMNKQLSSVGK